MDLGDQLGRYELIEELGAGGMATVYRARDLELRRDVALKVLFSHLTRRREVVARFHREARAAAGLDHHNIVRVYDVGGGPPASVPGARGGGAGTETDPADGAPDPCDPPYIVMELVRGQSLQELIKAHGAEHGQLLGEVVACMGAVLCDALSAAHDAGIVHRDVKPGNIMVAEGGRLALTDFGVARIDDDDSSVVTRTGALVGTPAYMSPEQAMGDELDARSDLYSLGATLYRLATGAMPFTGPTARVVHAIARGEAKPPLMRNPAMGPDLAAIIERMMARDRADRYQTCGDAGAELRDLVAASGLGDPAEELAAFFADRAGYHASRAPAIIRATLARARESAARRSLPRAMALADRVMAMDESGAHGEEAMALVQGLGDGVRWRRKAVVAGAVIALAGCVAAVGLWLPGADRSRVAGVLDAGEIDAGLVVAGDAATRDAGWMAELPVAPDAAPTAEIDAAVHARAPERRVVRTGRISARPRRAVPDAAVAATTPPPPPDAAPPSREPDAAPAAATIQVDIRPWCDLRIDGTDHGRARRDRVISLRPGKHILVCSQGSGGGTWRRTITLEPGQHLPLTGTVLRPVRIRISLARGDRVKVRGQLLATGDSIELAPGRYRFELYRGNERLTRAWVNISAVSGCTLRDQPALDCYR